MYRNIILLNANGRGIGISHDPKTGRANTKEFDMDEFKFASDANLALTSFYLESLLEKKIEKEIRLNIVALDNTAIKAFSIEKALKIGKSTADEVVEVLNQDFYNEVTKAELDKFVKAYMAFRKAGNQISFRKASEVDEAKYRKGTLTGVQKDLLRYAWDTVAPNEPLVFHEVEEEHGLF